MIIAHIGYQFVDLEIPSAEFAASFSCLFTSIIQQCQSWSVSIYNLGIDLFKYKLILLYLQLQTVLDKFSEEW